jgi:hypothetical protein
MSLGLTRFYLLLLSNLCASLRLFSLTLENPGTTLHGSYSYLFSVLNLFARFSTLCAGWCFPNICGVLLLIESHHNYCL